MERQQGTGNGWALSLDDLDVCQLLPLRGDQFEQGVNKNFGLGVLSLTVSYP